MTDIRCIAGYLTVSSQMLKQLESDKCQERSDYAYALRGERSDCVCGQHGNPVPLAPLFFHDPEEEDEDD
jgi:hypothetical protein